MTPPPPIPNPEPLTPSPYSYRNATIGSTFVARRAGTHVASSATATSNRAVAPNVTASRSEEHTSELQSPCNLVCRLLLEKKKNIQESLIIRNGTRYEPAG